MKPIKSSLARCWCIVNKLCSITFSVFI